MKALLEKHFVFVHGQQFTRCDPRRARRLARRRLADGIEMDESGVILNAMYKDVARNCHKLRYILRRRQNYQNGSYIIRVIRKPNPRW